MRTFFQTALLVFLSIHTVYSQNSDQNIGFTMPEVTRASPTVNSLIAMDDVNISYYTGQPNISIPIFEHSIKDLNYSLSLSYNSTGIRTNELSGWVGTGWSLETGGVISRSVVGLPDEMNSSINQGTGVYYLDINGAGNANSFYDLGEEYVFTSGGVGNVIGINHDDSYYYDAQWSDKKLDTHRDIYHFNFFGNSGQFIIERDSNGILEPKIIGNDSNIQFKYIDFVDNGIVAGYPVEEIESFELLDNKGYTYYFSAIEETTKSTQTVIKNIDGSDRTVNSANPISFRSSWRLTKIEDFNGNVLVSFDYHDPADEANFGEDDFTENIDRNNLRTIERYPVNCNLVSPSNSTLKSSTEEFTWQDIQNEIEWLSFLASTRANREAFFNSFNNGGGLSDGQRSAELQSALDSGGGGGPTVDLVTPVYDPPCPNQPNCVNQSFEPGFVGTKTSLAIRYSKKLKSVVFSDGVKVEIPILGNDLTNDHPEYYGWVLNSLSVSNNNGLLKKIEFDYDDSLRANSPTILFDGSLEYKGKLYLNGVKFYDKNLNDFEEYVLDYNTPTLGRTPGSDGSRLSLHAHNDFGYYFSGIRENYATDAIKGSLKSIKYPTGGKRKFNWESNTYSFSGNRLLSFEEIRDTPGNYNIYKFNRLHVSDHPGFLSNATFGNHYSSQNPSASTYPPKNDWILDVPENQFVEFSMTNVINANYLAPFNYYLFIIPIDQNNNPDNTKTETHLKLSQDNIQFRRKANLEKGRYRVFIGVNTLKPLPVNPPTTGPFAVSMDIEATITDLKDGPLNWFKYGGGIRVNSIENWDGSMLKSVNKYNYSLEPNVFSYEDLSADGYPLPIDYPGNPAFPNDSGVEFPVHRFSSGSLDGESNLTRSYVYSKHIDIVPNGNGNLEHYLTIETQEALNAQLTQGNFIGYKNVADYEDNNGILVNNIITNNINSIKNEKVTKYLYDSAIDYPMYPLFYVYPFPRVEDKDFLRGNLKKQTVYDSSNKKLIESFLNYNYEENDIEVEIAKRLDFIVNENNITGDQNILRSSAFIDYDDLMNFNYTNQATTFCETTPNYNPVYVYLNNSNQSIVNNNTPQITRDLVQYTPISKYKVQMISTEEKSYFYDGSESFDSTTGDIIPDKSVTNTTDYVYSNYNFLPKQITVVNSKGETLQTNTYYPDFSSIPSGLFTPIDLTNRDALRNSNRISAPLASESILNGTVMNTSKLSFRTFSGVLMTDQVHTSKGDDPLEPRLVYHRYDEFGNILEVSKKDGTRVSYIYGHSKTLPIAKIEGLSYEQLASKLAGVTTAQDIIDTIDEDDLPTINNLRDSFTVEDPFMVTTYEYEVGIGIKKVTDPRGRNMYYEYDDFNRLKAVRDHEGNILSENEYKYATQN